MSKYAFDLLLFFLVGLAIGMALREHAKQTDDTPPPEKTAAQPVSNILGLDEQLEGTG